MTQLTNGYRQKCDNYFFDGSSAQARLIETVPEYVAGVESFVVGDQDVFLLKLGLPACDQREEAWESGQLEAMEQQEKEAIIQVPSAYIDSPSEFHQVHGSANHSALGDPFRKIGDKLLYSVLEFGQPWELRSYDPVTANISRRALEDYMNYIPLVDGQPYLYELQDERYLLTSFFGEGSISYPSRWGMPEGICGNLLFSRYNLFLDGGPGRYSDHEMLVHDLETGELVAGGITFLFGPSGPILFA